MKTSTKISNLSYEQALDIYNNYWKAGSEYTLDEIKEHLTRTIIQLYLFRCNSQKCRDKCKRIIKSIKES
jgi:hypothetical protein